MRDSQNARPRDSIDIDEAMHPQTLLAWRMNGGDLPVPFA
jgi:DMSO/TMAO reductase YedYZ molybdopterin-dependent catalytic subunit